MQIKYNLNSCTPKSKINRTSILHSATLIIFSLVFFSLSCSKKILPTNQNHSVRRDIQILASDSFGGREAGTIYEIKARDYIADELQKAGLTPFFNNSYFQEFPFKAGADFSKSNIIIDGKTIVFGTQFQPLSNSKNDSLSGDILKVGYGIISSSPSYNDYPNHNILDGKIFVMDISVPGGYANYEQYAEVADLDKRIEMAEKFGAKAIILYTNDSSFNDPRKMISNKKSRTGIPVVYAKGDLLKKINISNQLNITIVVRGEKVDQKGYNVAGFLDKGKGKTIIIGAHYDHLGMGGETSRYFGQGIHNGADDNASGVAAILELARFFKAKELNTNILIVAFSAEEKGLYGSNYFVEHSIPALKKQVLCYLNYDMVGRMHPQEKKLTIFGTGTSPQWDSIFALIADTSMNITKSATGIGGSDQMPFYLDSIPVLFFFTGIHDQYHTPDDDEALINYQGIDLVLRFSVNLIEKTSNFKTLTWKPTQARTGSSGRGKGGPTLGIMPSYSNEGGVLVDMVIEGKTGYKAGLQKGDIITRIDQKIVKDVYDYMDIMKTLKNDIDYSIEIRRNGEIKVLTIRF
jgi:aminopeptidase YwaD